MYQTILALHSLTRWLVLISLLYALYRAYRGWLGNKAFSKTDNRVRSVTAAIAHVQLLVGLALYVISPVTGYFRQHFKEAVHERPIRFFGMEHSIMMLIAIVFITIGSSAAKRRPAGRQQFKTMAVWFSLALLIILLSIPWPFSPMASRPYIRSF